MFSLCWAQFINNKVQNSVVFGSLYAVSRVSVIETIDHLKGASSRKKSLAQMKEHEKCKKKRPITDLNAPNGSRDVPFQSQEFEQYGRHHFVHF